MHLSNESLLVILFVGLVAGWLAGQIVRGVGFELIGDLVIGIIGAFIGDWLLPQIGIHLGTGIVSAIINAAIGAVLLLLVVGLLRGRLGGGWADAGADADGGSGQEEKSRPMQTRAAVPRSWKKSFLRNVRNKNAAEAGLKI